MHLLNNLYTITNEDTAEGVFEIRLDRDCFIYAAHFPGNPITPGVCVIQILEELAERMNGTRLQIDVIKNAKFLRVLQPDGNVLTVKIVVKAKDENSVSFQGVISDKENNIYAKVSVQASIA